MISYATAAMVFFASALMLPAGSIQTNPANVSSHCESYQTECTFGCCPFAEAVCCADGFECCQHGQTCVPYIGLCIGISSADGQTALSSSKSVPVSGHVFSCPAGTTECGKDKCCPFPDATCCSDGEHCCPQGYSCDLVSKTCNKAPNNLVSSLTREKPLAGAKEGEDWLLYSSQKTVGNHRDESRFRPCPGFGPTLPCPPFMLCCIYDEGEQTCCMNSKGEPTCEGERTCLNATLSQTKYV